MLKVGLVLFVFVPSMCVTVLTSEIQLDKLTEGMSNFAANFYQVFFTIFFNENYV